MERFQARASTICQVIKVNVTKFPQFGMSCAFCFVLFCFVLFCFYNKRYSDCAVPYAGP